LKTLFFVFIFILASYLVDVNLAIYPKYLSSIIYMVLLVGLFTIIYLKDTKSVLKSKF